MDRSIISEAFDDLWKLTNPNKQFETGRKRPFQSEELLVNTALQQEDEQTIREVLDKLPEGVSVNFEYNNGTHSKHWRKTKQGYMGFGQDYAYNVDHVVHSMMSKSRDEWGNSRVVIRNSKEENYQKSLTAIREAFDESALTINSFRKLSKVHSTSIRSFILGKTLLYDYVDSLEDNWSESIDGVKDEDEAFSLFRIRGNNAYLPKGTTLDYVGHDNYYDWFRVNGTNKKIGFISDYSMYD